MSVRRKTNNRLALIRTCGTCGQEFRTTASSPFIRQLPQGGKKQATTYFCCESCFRASYKYKPWENQVEKHMAREAARDISEKNRRYYQRHAEQERQRQREAYMRNRDAKIMDMRFQRQKRRILEAAG